MSVVQEDVAIQGVLLLHLLLPPVYLLAFLVPLIPPLLALLPRVRPLFCSKKKAMSELEKLQVRWAVHGRRDDSTPCQIEEGLFLGSLGVALNKSALKRLNVTHVLTVSSSIRRPYPNDFVYKEIKVRDIPETRLEDYFDQCFRFIDNARSQGGAVLVHCFAGRSRSVTIIAAYLMKSRSMGLREAMSLVKRKRPFISPNYGFMLQLKKFEDSLGDEICISDVEQE